MNIKYNNAFSIVLQKLSIEINKLDDEDIKAVVDGNAEIVLQIVPKEQISDCKTDSDFEKIIQHIEKMTSSKDGVSYLKEHVPTKNQLKILAKKLDIPIRRTDKLDQIVEKIIESTIGFRLRSKAIQGADINKK
ncbi:MAG: hypothetical protein GY795_10495 [Desulfobacterales bacterium]|nr:hypothetical protein [Desulfobacterales bacterium]